MGIYLIIAAFLAIIGLGALTYEIFIFRKGGKLPPFFEDWMVGWLLLVWGSSAIGALMDRAGAESNPPAVKLAAATFVALFIVLMPFTKSNPRMPHRKRPLVFVTVSATVLVAGSIRLYALA